MVRKLVKNRLHEFESKLLERLLTEEKEFYIVTYLEFEVKGKRYTVSFVKAEVFDDVSDAFNSKMNWEKRGNRKAAVFRVQLQSKDYQGDF